MPLQPGVLLNDRYRIEETIARGGMGAVYRALDTTLNIQVAVKENFQNSAQFNRQFRLEATLLAGLNHPNLPRVTDHFTVDDDHLYLVMDFIDGIDLRARIAAEGRMQEEEVLRVGEIVCNALAYLHSRQPPIVHRDVKPGNIKITSNGQIILVDFGLAKLDAYGKTSTGAQAFTPGYSPPEQYGSGTETRSDLYSLGATLYAALTGKIPQDGLERAMGTCVLTPISQHNPNATVQTCNVIEKAMSIRPEERFTSAEEFRNALHTCRIGLSNPAIKTTYSQVTGLGDPAQQAVLAQNGKPPENVDTQILTKKNAKTGQKWYRWIGVGLFLLAAASAAMIIIPRTFSPQPTAQWILPSPNPPTAQAFIVEDTPTPSNDEKTTTPVPAATNTPAAASTIPPPLPPTVTLTATTVATPLGGSPGILAFSSSRSGIPQIWIAGVGAGNPFQVTNLPEGACQPDWSSDGTRIVFISPCAGRKDTYPGSSLFLINADGTNLIPLATLPGGDYDPAWSPDGAKIAFASIRGGRENIYLYDLSANKVIRLSSPVNAERRPAWSPDGKMIAYETHRNGPSQIWVMSSNGQNMREFSNLQSGDSRMPAWSPVDASNPAKLIVYSQGNQQPFLTGREFNNPSASEYHLSEKVRGVLNPRFSPDGWWIAMTLLDETAASHIAILFRNGNNLTIIPGTLAGDFHPSWRPLPPVK